MISTPEPNVYESELRLDMRPEGALVAPGADLNITAMPQMVFRAKAWEIEEGEEAFEIVDILCGNHSQMHKFDLSDGEKVRGTFFKKRNFILDTLNIGMVLRVRLLNTSPEPRTFKSKMIGDCV